MNSDTFPPGIEDVLSFPYLDLEFYDHYFNPGAYLRTHAEHMQRWHPE